MESFFLRPINSNKFGITIRNTSQTLQFQNISLFDLSSDTEILFHQRNYFISPQSTVTIEIPLIYNGYDFNFVVNTFKVLNEPVQNDVQLEFEFL